MDEVNGSMRVLQSEVERDSEQYLETNSTTNTMNLFSMYSNETELNFNASNLTSIADLRNTYKPVLSALIMALLIVVMLTMGCDISWQNLLSHFKKPIGLLIGIFSQFLALPLAAFCILLISGITGLHATVILIISCCPGGVLSNTYTYFCNGDSSLSVAMTCTSTLIAMGMMPLNMWLYGRHFESQDLVIPYIKMVMSLIIVIIPFVIGMCIKWKFPRASGYITKVGGYCVFILLIGCLVMEFVVFPHMFVGIPFKLYAVLLLLLIVGLTLGYGLAYIFRQNKRIRRTIAVECGVQNGAIALTVIALSFPMQVQEDMLPLPWIYGVTSMISCTIICLSYQFYLKCSKMTDGNIGDGITEIKGQKNQRNENVMESYVMKK